MLGTMVNVALVVAGSLLGLLLRGKLTEQLSGSIIKGLALCVLLIGVRAAIGTNDLLCVIVCMVIGILIGELLRIEDRLDGLGERLRRRLMKERGENRFTEGFVTASLLFCVGSMAVMGSIEAGLNHNYSILISKGVIDGVTAVTFAAAMGIGVLFSAIPLLVYQGGLTLLASAAAPLLEDSAGVSEMSAVGGLLIIGLALKMLFPETKIRVGNMLPAIFLPFAYLPLSEWLAKLFS